MLKRSLITLLLLIPSFGWAAENSPSSAEVLTLEQAVALALENNRAVRNSELEVSKQDDSVAIARTRRLPDFSANIFGSMLLQNIEYTFKQGDFGTFPSGGPNPSTDVRITTPRKFNTFAFVSVDQPLSQLYRVNLGIQSAKIGFQLAGQDLRSQKHTVANSVKAAYFAVLQSQSALQAMQQSMKLYQELDRVTGEFAEAIEDLPSSLRRDDAALADAARAALRRALGRRLQKRPLVDVHLLRI